jgi:hypothetical protein
VSVGSALSPEQPVASTSTKTPNNALAQLEICRIRLFFLMGLLLHFAPIAPMRNVQLSSEET